MAIGFATMPFLGPFAVFSFLQGRITMGLLATSITALSFINAVVIHRRGRALVPFEAIYVLIFTGLLWGITTIGPAVAYWCYPTAFVVLFVVDQQRARLLIGLSICLLLPTVFLTSNLDAAGRFAITYVMSCYFGDLVMSELYGLQRQLTAAARTDPLTGAFNRRHMEACLEETIESQQRGLVSPGLLSLDIDHFKRINDGLGHAAGDQVLVGFVQHLRRRLRKVDVLFRAGGEEFVVLLRDVEPEQTARVAEDLRRHVEAAGLLPDRTVTVSIGHASYRPGEDLDAWLRRVDGNLYEAKRRGRNRVWPAMHQT